jgi:hypothetical protein
MRSHYSMQDSTVHDNSQGFVESSTPALTIIMISGAVQGCHEKFKRAITTNIVRWNDMWQK